MSDFMAYRLYAARTNFIKADPDTLVLALEYGDGERLHLMLSRAEFSRLAKQMAADAVTLSATPARHQKN